MSQKIIITTIKNWEEWVEAYVIANGNELDDKSGEWVLKRMESILFAQYNRGKQEMKKKEAVINKNIISVKEKTNG